MNPEVNLSILFKRASLLQVLYWALVAAWNIAGLVLINMGQPALGPTASLLPVFALGVITVFMLYAGIKGSKVYPYIGSAVLLLAVIIVAQAFIKAPDLWPSDAWRYAGVAVNGFGALSAVMGLVWYFKRLNL